MSKSKLFSKAAIFGGSSDADTFGNVSNNYIPVASNPSPDTYELHVYLTSNPGFETSFAVKVGDLTSSGMDVSNMPSSEVVHRYTPTAANSSSTFKVILPPFSTAFLYGGGTNYISWNIVGVKLD